MARMGRSSARRSWAVLDEVARDQGDEMCTRSIRFHQLEILVIEKFWPV
jgi:hypothetical protein